MSESTGGVDYNVKPSAEQMETTALKHVSVYQIMRGLRAQKHVTP